MPRSPLAEVLEAPSPKADLLVTEYSAVEDADELTPIDVPVPTAKRCESPSAPLKVKVPVLPPPAPVVLEP